MGAGSIERRPREVKGHFCHAMMQSRVFFLRSLLSEVGTKVPARLCSSRASIDLHLHSNDSCHGNVVGEDEAGTRSEERVLRAAVIGAPNAGKSSLVNVLMGHKIFAVSPSVHTTTRNALGVFTEGDTQVILVDTPGVVPYRYGHRLKVSKEFLSDPYRSLLQADMAVVVVDAANKFTRGELSPDVLRTLRQHPHLPLALVLNKVDLVRHKQVLLRVTGDLTSSWERVGEGPQSEQEEEEKDEQEEEEKEGKREQAVRRRLAHFQEVFMVSSLSGDGVEDVKRYLMSLARPGRWEYCSDEVTDQADLTLVEDIVREKLFLYLRKEIPYVITQENVIWKKMDDGTLSIFQNLNCRNRSQVSILIGPSGRTIQAVTAEATSEIETLLKCPVELTLNVRAKK